MMVDETIDARSAHMRRCAEATRPKETVTPFPGWDAAAVARSTHYSLNDQPNAIGGPAPSSARDPSQR